MCLEFAGLEFGEISGRGALEALVTVDDTVDLSGRKNEPIFGRRVLQTSHFTQLKEGGRFFHCGVVLGFAFGLDEF
jgi:hypothetical protein